MSRVSDILRLTPAPFAVEPIAPWPETPLYTPRQRQMHVVNDVVIERLRQDGKWGGWPGVDRVDERYTAVLGEEFGEVCKAQLENGELSDELRTELVQVAAVAVAWVEQIDALREEQSCG